MSLQILTKDILQNVVAYENSLILCSSRNIHTHTKKGHWKFQRGGELQYPKFLKKSMKVNGNFQGCCALKTKNLLWKWFGYFLAVPQEINKENACFAKASEFCMRMNLLLELTKTTV